MARRRPKPRDSEAELPSGDPSDRHEGVVVRVDARQCRVREGGVTHDCRIRGALFHEEADFTRPVAVGDRVRFSLLPGPVVEEVLPRKNWLARPQFYRKGLQMIAANLDQAILVLSWAEPRPNLRLLDRQLVFCELSDIPALVVINKVDLAHSPKTLAEVGGIYRDLGYTVLETSVPERRGIDALRERLTGAISVFSGMSGVGKSALLTSVEPTLALRSGEVSGLTGKGRHTTTHVALLELPFGGYVVDTPGVREFGLGDRPAAEIARGFLEFLPFVDRCRYRSCSHSHEVPCAVKDAVERREIHPHRYDSYLRIITSSDD